MTGDAKLQIAKNDTKDTAPQKTAESPIEKSKSADGKSNRGKAAGSRSNARATSGAADRESTAKPKTDDRKTQDGKDDAVTPAKQKRDKAPAASTAESPADKRTLIDDSALVLRMKSQVAVVDEMLRIQELAKEGLKAVNAKLKAEQMLLSQIVRGKDADQMELGYSDAPDGWQEAKIEALGLPNKVTAALSSFGLKTVGQVETKMATGLSDISGISKAVANKIAESIGAFSVTFDK